MSFDWDSIKVINNPDLKEIEALFTPNSALSGTASDPTDAVGPPIDQPDGGGTDDGGEPGGGVIDCQPPEGYEECLGHDCYAFNDFASGLPNPDSVRAIPTYDNSFSSSIGVYPGFKLINSSNTVQNEVNSLALANANTDTPLCNPLKVYGFKVGTTASSSIRYVPDGLFEDLGTSTGEGKSYSGKMSAYLYGLNEIGDITFVPSNDKFTFAETSLQAYKDGDPFKFCSASRIEAEIWNDTTAGVVHGRLFDQDFIIKEDTADVSGVYTVEWTAEVSGGLSPVITTSMKFSGPNFEKTANRTATPNGDWVADSYVNLGTYAQDSFPKYFSNGPQPSFSPKALYIADTSVVPEVDFKLACERSLKGYTAPADCVPWVRPEGCPDCSNSLPDDCFPECDSYKSQLVTGATMGTQEELDSIYGTGPLDFGGIRFINKIGYNPSQGTDPDILPSYDTVEFAPLVAGPLDTDLPCSEPVLGLRPQEGFSQARLTIFSAAEMSSFQYQGDYTDTTADPPRKLVNDRVGGGYSALLHCPADTGSTKLIELSVPIKVYNGVLQAGTRWDLSWDRTAKQITITQGDGTNKVIGYNGGPLIDLTVQASVFVKCVELESGFLTRTDDFSANVTVNGIPASVASITESGLLVYGQWLGHYSNIDSGTILGEAVRVLAISKEGGAGYVAVKEAVKRSFSTYVSTDSRCTGILECLQDCDAAENFVLESGGQATSLVSEGSKPAAPANFEGWGHRYVVNDNNFGNYTTYTLGTLLTDVSGNGMPCSTGLYCDPAIASNTTSSNFRCVPDSVFGALGTVVGTGQSFNVSGGNYFYLYGKNRDGSPKTINFSSILTSTAGARFGGSNNGFPQTNTIDFELNTVGDVATLKMTYYVYDSGLNYVGLETETLSFPSKDVTGGYTMSFNITYSLSGNGVYSATNTASVSCPAGTLSASSTSGSAVVGLEGIPDISLETGSSKSFPVYFRASSGSNATTPTVLYTGSAADPEFVANLEKAIERSFVGYRSTDPECTDPVLPEGCPEKICPDNTCPCSCRGQSYDPLGCNASVITGGLYDENTYPARVDGTFLNYDDSQGRVVYWENGSGNSDSFDSTEMMDVAFDENNAYRVLGTRQTYDSTQRAYVDPTADIRGVISSGSAANGTFEFCALVGYLDNPNNNPQLIIPEDVVGDSFKNNGRVNFTRRSKFKQISGSRTWIQPMGDFDVSMQRRGPSTVSYNRYDLGGASTVVEVTLPESVLNPADKLVWFSAKVFVQASEQGPANEVIPGFTNPTYWAYKTRALADLYVNGFKIASGVRVHRKSGYLNDEIDQYIVENTGFNPAALQTTIFDDNNALDNNDFVPAVGVQDPNTGSERLFIAFMDNGPGASLIPGTEQGRNLARVDPNNTPYLDCDCP